MPGTEPARGPARALPLLLACISALANLSFLAEGLVGSRLPWGTSLVSELSAVGQPGAWVFRAGDITQGLTGLLLVVPLARRWGWRGVAGWTLVTAALLYAAGTLVQALVPEPCSPTLDPSCHPDTGILDLLGHGATSVIAAAAAIGSLVGLTVIHLRPGLLPAWRPPRHRLLLAALAATLAVVVLGSGLTEIVWSLFPVEIPALGTLQRLQLACLSGWTLWLGVLAVAPRQPGAAHASSPGDERL
ncbi:MAG: DUF998 domain-containing protein [Kineosporiaceae bacterium]